MASEDNKLRLRKATEAEVGAFHNNLGLFVVAAEKTRMPMIFTNAEEPGNPIIFCNDSFLALFGYEREELIGQGLNILVAPGSDAETRSAAELAFGASREGDWEVRCGRKDGSGFWAAVFTTPICDENGQVEQHFLSFVDLTKHKQEAARLRFLLDELNHRTQNTLATVIGISKQTFRGIAHKERLAIFEGRILALAKAQSLLGRVNWERIGLREVIERILEPFGFKNDCVCCFLVRGRDVFLQSKTALTIAMVFHELATNAANHGALSNLATGRVEIGWQVEPTPRGNRMRLRWEESGGPPVRPPERKGFGSRLIERDLAQELNGDVHLEYNPAGMICQIVIPVEEELEDRR